MEFEATSLLVLFLGDWKVDAFLRDGESRLEYEERFKSKACHCKVSLTFRVGPVKLKLTKRP